MIVMVRMAFCVLLGLISWSVLKAICYNMGLWDAIEVSSSLSRHKWRKKGFFQFCPDNI